MSKEDNLTDNEKTLLAMNGVESFIGSFGPDDLCRQALLEIILETIYGQNVSLSGTQGQTGNQSDNNIRG